MDDVPAGPASPGPRRPPLSVVIPVHNGGRDFERCLRRLRDSLRADYELIVVDDGSTDGSAALAESFGAGSSATRRRWARPRPGTPGPRPRRPPLDLLPRRRRRRPPRRRSPGPWPGSRPTPASPALFGSYDDAPDRPRAGQPVPQPAPPLRPPAGRVRRRRPPGPHLLDRLRRDPPRRSSSTSAASTPSSTAGPRSRTSSSATGSPAPGTGSSWPATSRRPT